METTYNTKRRKAGMSRSEMATALGISHRQYKLIERGVVKMPTKLIDTFNEIVNRGKEIHKLEALDNQREINDFYNSMTTKVGNVYKLWDKMQSFNITTYKELAQLLGYKNGSAISHYLAKPDETPDAFKHMLYTFFQDELNIQPPKIEDTKKEYSKKIINNVQTELLEWYNEFDFNTFLIDNNLSQKEFSHIVGIEKSSMSNYVTKKTKPSEKQLVKLKKGVDMIMRKTNTGEVKMVFNNVEEVTESIYEEQTIERRDMIKECVNEFTSEITPNDSLSEKYSNIIAEINRELSYLESKIVELRNRREIYEEVLKDVSTRGV